jgi:hypothetical protein
MRGCSRNCLLAPYFPADKPKALLNAHRLFGITNMQNRLKEIEDDGDKNNLMESIIFELGVLARYPILGCLGIILILDLNVSFDVIYNNNYYYYYYYYFLWCFLCII